MFIEAGNFTEILVPAWTVNEIIADIALPFRVEQEPAAAATAAGCANPGT